MLVETRPGSTDGTGDPNQFYAWLIRHKPTGGFLPQTYSQRGRTGRGSGGTRVEPKIPSVAEPRLFMSERTAKQALSMWLRGPHPFSRDYSKPADAVERRAEDMEIVRVNIRVKPMEIAFPPSPAETRDHSGKTSSDFMEVIKEILTDIIGVDTDHKDLKNMRPRDFSLDSLDMVEIAMALEDRFEVTVEDSFLESMKDDTFGRISVAFEDHFGQR